MTFSSIYELSEFINRKHNTFCGHSIVPNCANVRTFDTLMRAADFLRKESAAKSIIFDASIFAQGVTVPTQIAICISDSGFDYSETVIH